MAPALVGRVQNGGPTGAIDSPSSARTSEFFPLQRILLLLAFHNPSSTEEAGLGLPRFEVLVDTASLLLWLVLPQLALFDNVSGLRHSSDAAKLLVYDKHQRFLSA